MTPYATFICEAPGLLHFQAYWNQGQDYTAGGNFPQDQHFGMAGGHPLPADYPHPQSMTLEQMWLEAQQTAMKQLGMYAPGE